MAVRFSTRPERAAAEIAHGQRITHRNMAEGLLDNLKSELPGGKNLDLDLDWSDNDVQKWTVNVKIASKGFTHNEPFMDFPTNELRTLLMLLQ